MKKAVFWVIKPQFISDRKHITSLLQSPAGVTFHKTEFFI
jgi:hypothetical protein